jgi:hypothetical protein
MNSDIQKNNNDYHFNGSISRPVLENYLSRSITMTRMLIAMGPVEDNLRMIKAIRPKFIGRRLALWSSEMAIETNLYTAGIIEKQVHSIDPEIIIQAAIFEAVGKDEPMGFITQICRGRDVWPEADRKRQ